MSVIFMDHIGPCWTCPLFGPIFLDPSIWIRLFGPVYLDPSIWTHLFGPVYLDKNKKFVISTCNVMINGQFLAVFPDFFKNDAL